MVLGHLLGQKLECYQHITDRDNSNPTYRALGQTGRVTSDVTVSFFLSRLYLIYLRSSVRFFSLLEAAQHKLLASSAVKQQWQP